MKRILLTLLIGLLSFVTVYAIWRLNSSPTFHPTAKGFVNQDVVAQLAFLKQELLDGGDDRMQEIFPEGYVFTNVLFALAWTNVMEHANKDSLIYNKALKNIRSSLRRIQSDKGKKPFSDELLLKRGAFYRGWTNYLLGKKLLAQHAHERDSIQMEEFKQNCTDIHKAFHNSENLYLESYHGSIWPADNIVCLASLSLYNQLVAPDYADFLKQRVELIKTLLDPKTGLIPHSIKENNVWEGARGSSQSLMNVFLKDIDPYFADQQYTLFKKHFLDHRLALSGIREYPLGQTGEGDVDAGPIIWDIGGAASVVGIAAATTNNDLELSRSLRNAIETFGIPYTMSHKKRYLFGQLIMADAFIAWANSMEKKRD